MSYPGAAAVEIIEGPVVQVEVTRQKPVYSRSDRLALQAGVTEYDVPINTTLPDNNYNVVSLQVNNYVDNRNLIPFIKAFAWGVRGANSFQVKLEEPPPTDNFVLEWAIAENYNP